LFLKSLPPSGWNCLALRKGGLLLGAEDVGLHMAYPGLLVEPGLHLAFPLGFLFLI